MFLALEMAMASAAPASHSNPAPPNWGGNSSVLAWSAQVSMTDKSDSPLHPKWSFSYFYDWNLRASRYEHGEGQHDEVCKMAKIVGDPCTVLNAANNKMYLLGASSCCRCDASWAPFTIVPNWLSRDNATYVGTASIGGRAADEWLAYGASDNHYFASTDTSSAPIRYMEHKNGLLKQWDFTQWEPQTPPPAKFDAPPKCDTQCASASCR